MKSNNKQKGAIGEKLAQDFLKKQKYKILDTNWHYSKFCELDIVAKEKDTLVFIEVKYRTSTALGSPFDAINYSKLQHLQTAVTAYLQQTQEKFKNYRLDVIGIIDNNNEIKIDHLKNINI